MTVNLSFLDVILLVKFLNFITEYDVINLPMKKLYNAIRKNLATAQSLIYVFQFNQPCWEQELRLGSGDQDWEQWQVLINFYMDFWHGLTETTFVNAIFISEPPRP